MIEDDISANIVANSEPRVAIDGAEGVDGDSVVCDWNRWVEWGETNRNSLVMVSDVIAVEVGSVVAITFEPQYLQENRAHRHVGDNQRYPAVVSMYSGAYCAGRNLM